MRVVISSGHAKHVSGAAGVLNEVTEARRVTDQVAKDLRAAGAEAVVHHDDTSRTQRENINGIVAFHNSQTRHLDLSIHFNASKSTDKPVGTEALYLGEQLLAAKLSKAIATAGGFLDRGAKRRTDLGFLNSTKKPAVLLEICFVDSTHDAKLYRENFSAICRAIASTIIGQTITASPQASTPAGRPTLRRGAKGEAVGELQRLLGGLKVDEDFGGLTEAAVKSFQTVYGLVVDGVVGATTWANLLEKK
jgi:N-acetylmuramoyl-L-alanine amidase